MQKISIWHKFHIHRTKGIIAALFFYLCLSAMDAQAQKIKTINLPNSDERWLNYGFLIGGHISGYKIRYSPAFTDSLMSPIPNMDSVTAIESKYRPGFSLGFILNLRLTEYFDLRFLPQVVFYEHEIAYSYAEPSANGSQILEATQIEFPLMLKYKSERRGNARMYFIGGINPSFEAKGKNNQEGGEKLGLKDTNVAVEFGFGVDIYNQFFKFSPEIRFSKGLTNLAKHDNMYDLGLERVSMNTVTLFLQFSD
jgi:hypothetical protein